MKVLTSQAELEGAPRSAASAALNMMCGSIYDCWVWYIVCLC